MLASLSLSIKKNNAGFYPLIRYYDWNLTQRGNQRPHTKAIEMDHLDEKIIHAYVDQVLNREEALAISAHLVHCTRCRHEVETLTSVVQALAELPVPPPSRGLTPRILKAARGETWETPLSLDRIASLFGPMGWSAMAMGLLAGILLGLCVKGHEISPSPDSYATVTEAMDIYEGYLISDNGDLL